MKKPLHPLLIVALLGLLCLVANYQLVPLSLAITDSDVILISLWTEWFRKSGHWTPFMFNQGYGGTLFGTIRALWVTATDPLLGTVRAHAVF